MTTAVGYIRVSTREQALEGYGLEVQERQIRNYARDHNLTLAELYIDAGESGSEGLDKRIGLAAALREIEAGRATVLVIPRLDRLARDLLLQETIMAKLRQGGGSVISVAEPDIDGDDPTRTLVRQVLGAIAQYERTVIRGRMMAGKAAKVAKGGYGGGRPRYGLMAEDKELVEHPEEAATVLRIRCLREEGYSLRQIAGTLESEGRRPKIGSKWHPMAVARVLARDESGCHASSTSSLPESDAELGLMLAEPSAT